MERNDDAGAEAGLSAEREGWVPWLEGWRQLEQIWNVAGGAQPGPFGLVGDQMSALLEAQAGWLRTWSEVWNGGEGNALSAVLEWNRQLAEQQELLRRQIFDAWLENTRSLDWNPWERSIQQAFGALQQAFGRATGLAPSQPGAETGSRRVTRAAERSA